MSWIFGVTSNVNLERFNLSQINYFLPPNHKLLKSNNHIITFDDSVNLNYSEHKNFIVRGVCLRREGEKYHWLNKNDQFDNLDLFNPEGLTGQYLFVRWSDNEILFQNDYFGLNTIYLYKKFELIYFSTRLDYLCHIIDSPRIDFNAFSGRWLLFNQLNDDAIIEDVIKLPPNSEIRISGNRITTKTNNDSSSDRNDSYFIKTFDRLCDIQLPEDYKISLGLSGGLDSRVLLDRYLNLKTDISVHSFGEKSDADVLIAQAISTKNQLNHSLLLYDLKPVNILEEAKTFISLNEVVDPFSTYLLTSSINDTQFRNKVLIDGAGGELFRRQFLNNLLIRGKKELITQNPKGIFRFMSHFRADIFSDEINSQMNESCLKQLSDRMNCLPDIKEIGLENYVDLLSATTRFTNYYGPEQNRLNSILPSFMPFVTMELFKYLLNIPLEKRRNNKMFYDLLSLSNNGLNKFRLVKNGVTYPFGLKNKSIYLYVYTKQRIFKTVSRSLKEKFYLQNKEIISEVLRSDEFKSNEIYNHKKVDLIINGFHKGEMHYLNQIDWVFSFEIFRKSLNLNK